jgi:hypothetical protein
MAVAAAACPAWSPAALAPVYRMLALPYRAHALFEAGVSWRAQAL